jgi:deazaflavin-dependent oxidoreductase (nitroreductase family)
MNRKTVQFWSRVHAVTYRVSGGRLGPRLAGIDVLLLTTTGNRTGKPRTVPLLHLRDGADHIVVASYGGRPHHPDWYTNLTANPHAELQVEGHRFAVAASTLPPGERHVWWRRAVAEWPDFAAYQRRTEREIPLVRLSPISTGSGSNAPEAGIIAP